MVVRKSYNPIKKARIGSIPKKSGSPSYPQEYETHILLFSSLFPNFPSPLHKVKRPRLKSAKYPSRDHRLVLSIGGNLKSPIHTFYCLFFWLYKNPRFHNIKTSPIHKNPPFGYLDQPDFYNATLQLSTKLCLCDVFQTIFYLERRFGRPRKRKFKNAPRTLDIDLIFFDDLRVCLPHLKVPHSYFNVRESVIIPLMLQGLD